LSLKDNRLLKQIAEVEDNLPHDSLAAKLGWRFKDVAIWPSILARLEMDGLVETVVHTHSYHGYRLTPKGRALISNQFCESYTELTLPDDIFEDIIGHENIKELLRASLMAEKPVHVLLMGPPALAKTLFLWDIERIYGERAIWLIGSATSKAGLWDLVAEKQPEVLLIDELSSMNATDTSALLSLMEGGRLVRTKKARELDIKVKVTVIAATNRLHGLSAELLSRFAKREIKPYSREDYQAVVRGVLVRHEHLNADMAEEIAQKLNGKSQDVRDAVRVARLAPQLGVDKAIQLLLG